MSDSVLPHRRQPTRHSYMHISKHHITHFILFFFLHNKRTLIVQKNLFPITTEETSKEFYKNSQYFEQLEKQITR